MTGEEWFATNDACRMLDSVADRVSARKLRLFACACLRTVTGLPWEWEVRESIKYVEKYCDGLLRWDEVSSRIRKKSFAAGAFLDTDAEGLRFPPLLSTHPVQAAREMIDYCVTEIGHSLPCVPLASLAHPLRDIVGNPFRAVAFSPQWRTTTAVQLARGMYEGRDFSAMPILADALQDAGCDSDDVLNHCRDEKQPHVRGCWVVDLVLNKA
jgi:hypothetical protein